MCDFENWFGGSFLFVRIMFAFWVQQVLDAVRDGQSIFFTGCAGTGKSFVLKNILSSVATAGLAYAYIRCVNFTYLVSIY